MIDVETKIAKIENKDERKVAEFLRDLGFHLIDSNLKIGEKQEQLLGEIDLLYEFQNYLFIIEVGKEKTSNKKKFAFFTKWTDKDILKWITKKCQVKPKKIVRIYFDLGTRTPEQNISPMLDMITKKSKMNLVVYANMYEYIYDTFATLLCYLFSVMQLVL